MDLSCHSGLTYLLVFLSPMCKHKECFKEWDYGCEEFHVPPGQAGSSPELCLAHEEGGLVSGTVSLALL